MTSSIILVILIITEVTRVINLLKHYPIIFDKSGNCTSTHFSFDNTSTFRYSAPGSNAAAAAAVVVRASSPFSRSPSFGADTAGLV